MAHFGACAHMYLFFSLDISFEQNDGLLTRAIIDKDKREFVLKTIQNMEKSINENIKLDLGIEFQSEIDYIKTAYELVEPINPSSNDNEIDSEIAKIRELYNNKFFGLSFMYAMRCAAAMQMLLMDETSGKLVHEVRLNMEFTARSSEQEALNFAQFLKYLRDRILKPDYGEETSKCPCGHMR